MRELKINDLWGTEYPTGETLLEVYAWTLSIGFVAERYLKSQCPSLESFKDTIRNVSNNSQSTINHKGLFDSALFIARGRKLLFTQNGYIGIGPGETQPGKQAPNP